MLFKTLAVVPALAAVVVANEAISLQMRTFAGLAGRANTPGCQKQFGANYVGCYDDTHCMPAGSTCCEGGKYCSGTEYCLPGGAYCCPQGTPVSECAAKYTVTLTATATETVSGSGSVVTATATATIVSPHTGPTTTTTAAAVSTSTAVVATSTVVVVTGTGGKPIYTVNGTSPTMSSPPSSYTGAASRNSVAGFALAAGAAFAFLGF